jgi:hypothetical protein
MSVDETSHLDDGKLLERIKEMQINKKHFFFENKNKSPTLESHWCRNKHMLWHVHHWYVRWHVHWYNPRHVHRPVWWYVCECLVKIRLETGMCISMCAGVNIGMCSGIICIGVGVFTGMYIGISAAMSISISAGMIMNM